MVVGELLQFAAAHACVDFREPSGFVGIRGHWLDDTAGAADVEKDGQGNLRPKNKAPLTQRVTGRPLNSPPPSAARQPLYVLQGTQGMAPMGYPDSAKEPPMWKTWIITIGP